MLSRVADSLYWMSRYLERAEHTARLIDVNLTLMLDESGPASERRWQRVLRATGQPPAMANDRDGSELAHSLACDLKNTSSLIWCIMAARENARQVRQQISSEQWEQLNVLYHHVTNEGSSVSREALPDLLQAIIAGVHLLQGVTDSTMPHGEGWQFIRLGRYLERAYSHATLLDVYSSEFWNQPNRLTEGSDYLEGIGLLRSCTAFEAYCKVYTADISPERILEFLLLNSEFPHTIRYSIESVQDALDGLEAEARSRRVTSLHRISGRLRAALSYADISETILNGIGPYLRDIVRQCRDVHSKIYQLYINYSIESALAE